MSEFLRYAGQAIVYAGLMALVGIFADTPAYRHFPEGLALVKLTFAHGASHEGGCRRRTPEELAELPPNMRKLMDCPRQRLPVTVELFIDGERIYRETLPPTGLRGDGPSRVYKGFTVSAGRHKLAARLRDTSREQGFDYENEVVADLAPAQNFVIQFRPEAGGFIFN